MTNYTAVNIEKIRSQPDQTHGNGQNSANTILLLVATLTAAVIAIMLFLLIKNKYSRQAAQEKMTAPSSTVSQAPSSTPRPSLPAVTSPSATATAPGSVTTIVPPLETVFPTSSSAELSPGL